MPSKKKIQVTLKKSVISVPPKHKLCVKGLGLRRINQTAVVIDTPANRGMINKVAYLLLIEEV